MDDQKLKSAKQTMDRESQRNWVTPTFQRVDLKEAMHVVHASGSTADGGGLNQYTS